MGKNLFHVGNCPHCTKIIFRDGVFNAETEFSMRCPHCQKLVKIKIQRSVEITILPLGGGDQNKKPAGQGTAIMDKDL